MPVCNGNRRNVLVGDDRSDADRPEAPQPRAARVLVIGMHQLIRDALARLITDAGGFDMLAGADSGHEAVETCRHHAPDILIVPIDLEDGNGIDVTREVLRVKPETKVILIQSARDEDVTVRALRSGALGLVYTRAPANLLIEALRTVAQGRPYVGPPAWDVVLNRLKKTHRDGPPSGLKSLSPRHRQILALIVQGKTANEIAEKLGVTVSSIRNQRQTLMRRMKVKTTPELILAALAKGFKA